MMEYYIPKDTVLSVRNLKTYFYVDKKTTVKAVDDVSFDVYKGKVTAIVGQSGSGKSVTASAVFNLIESPGKIMSGEVYINGLNVLKLSRAKQRKIYGKDISMIFQEPMAALNPVIKVKKQMIEAIKLHRKISYKDAYLECKEALIRVNLKNPEHILEHYPFELSGGMCQRVMIAMSIAAKPDILVADEPTTALDLTIQAVVLEELNKLKDCGIGIMLITHDLGVVAQMADYVYVMHEGKIVESGEVLEIFDNPKHDYTKVLLNAVKEGGKHIGDDF